MKSNMHPLERTARIVLGAGIASMAYFGPTHPAFLLGVVPMLTGFVGICPFYAMLGINTCPRKK